MKLRFESLSDFSHFLSLLQINYICYYVILIIFNIFLVKLPAMILKKKKKKKKRTSILILKVNATRCIR